MNVRKTQAWETAEWEHAEVTADRMMPMLGGQLTLEQKIGRYEQILEGCPEFYPALLEMGFLEKEWGQVSHSYEPQTRHTKRARPSHSLLRKPPAFPQGAANSLAERERDG